MTDKVAAELARKLDTLIALTAFSVLHGKSQKEQIAALNRAGLGPTAIASLVGTNSNVVNVTLAKLKAARRKPPKKKT